MAFYYEAQNPYPSFFDKVRDFFSSSVSTSSKDFISIKVIPAQNRPPISLEAEHFKILENEYGVKSNLGYVKTHDGAKLETIEVYPKSFQKLPADTTYIIKFNGNGTLLQDMLDSFSHDATKLNCKVIGFNYRGVGKSEGKPRVKSNLVTDGIAQVQRLLDEGANPKNIFLDGTSLGGSIATLVAEYFDKLGITLNLFNFISFSSTSKFVLVKMAPDATGLKESIAEGCISTGLRCNDWQIDVADAYRQHPVDAKAYMVIKEEDPVTHYGDGVIPDKASLHSAFAKDKRGQGPFSILFAPSEVGHNLSRNTLKLDDNRSKSAQTAFEEFVNTHRLKK